MSYFGLTADTFCQASHVLLRSFDSPNSPTAGNGETIVNEAMERNEQLIRGCIPVQLERCLSKIQYEIVEDDATSGATTVTLGAPAVAGTVLVWTYADGEHITSRPRKIDALTEGNGITLGTDKLTVTLDTALTAGQYVLASYSTTLEDDCPTLRQVLIDLVRYDLLLNLRPDQRQRYELAYDKRMAYLKMLADGTATIREIAKLRMLDDPDPERADAGAVAYMREPA